jgi:hypothetical protein
MVILAPLKDVIKNLVQTGFAKVAIYDIEIQEQLIILLSRTALEFLKSGGSG